MIRQTLAISLLLVFFLALGCSSALNEPDPDTADGDIKTDGDDDTENSDLADIDAVDGESTDGDIADGDTIDGDIIDGDIFDGDITDGDVTDGDVTDGDSVDGDLTDGDDDTPLRINNLQLEANPNSALSTWLSFETSVPATASVEARIDDRLMFRFSPATEASLEHRLGLVGFRANTTYALTVIARDLDDHERRERTDFSSGPLPDDFPTLAISMLDSEKRQPGYVMINSSKKMDVMDDLTTSVATLIGFDREGEVVYYRVAPEPQPGGMFMVLKTGQIMYAHSNWSMFMELNWMGEIVREFSAADFGANYLDHNVEVLPNGHLVLLFNVGIESDAEAATDLDLVEATQDLEIVHRHRLDAKSGLALDSEVRDLDYDARDDSIVVLMKTRIIKIDRMTGTQIWEMSSAGGDFTWDGEGEFPLAMHGLQVQPNGNLLVFDNGEIGKGRFAGASELAYDAVAGTVSQSWRFTPIKPFFAPFMGNAIRLPNGNTLVNEGGRVEPVPVPHTRPHFIELAADDPNRLVIDISFMPELDGTNLEKMYLNYQAYFLESLSPQ